MAKNDTSVVFKSTVRTLDSSVIRLQDRIGYAFQDGEMLRHALTHASCSVENGCDNERLEFLGDAVLGLCVAQALYERFPDWDEGALTRLKSVLVCTSFLASAAQELDLRAVCRLGKGLPADEPLPQRVYANLFEAVCAAIYLDGGLHAAKAFVARLLEPQMRSLAAAGCEMNPKARLQQETQRRWGITPTYRLHGASGPDHGKTFEICVRLNGREFPVKCGRTKKEAEQHAAQVALEVLAAEGALREAAGSLPLGGAVPDSAEEL
jgi:ribonuclease-3